MRQCAAFERHILQRQVQAFGRVDPAFVSALRAIVKCSRISV